MYYCCCLWIVVVAIIITISGTNGRREYHRFNDYYGSLQTAIESFVFAKDDYLQTQQQRISLDRKYHLILPIDALGLANRLRIIASIYAIIQHHKRGNSAIELIVIWVSSVECPILFHEVFDSTSVHVISLDHGSLDDSHIVGSNDDDRLRTVESNLRKVVSNIVSKGKSWLRLKELHLSSFLVNADELFDRDDTSAIYLLWTRGTHALNSADCTDYLTTKSSFYRSLVPTKAVYDLMSTVDFSHRYRNAKYHQNDNEYSKNINGDDDDDDNDMVIGIHVRAFDSSYDWAVVHPLQSKARVVYNSTTMQIDVVAQQYIVSHNDDDGVGRQYGAKRFDQVSSIDAFIGFMNSMLATYPTARFFIASNSLQVKITIANHFMHRFGHGRILAIQSQLSSDSHDRGSKEGMVVAAADFLLLGQTRLIAHTISSSFGREAGCIHNVPVIDVSNIDASFPLMHSCLCTTH